MTHLAVFTTVRATPPRSASRVLVAGDATATRALPGAAGQSAVDVRSLQRAALAAMADRVADVMVSPAIIALPVTP